MQTFLTIVVPMLLAAGLIVYWQWPTISRWSKTGPIEYTLSQRSLNYEQAYKTVMEEGQKIQEEMSQRQSDMDAAHARISALRAPTGG